MEEPPYLAGGRSERRRLSPAAAALAGAALLALALAFAAGRFTASAPTGPASTGIPPPDPPPPVSATPRGTLGAAGSPAVPAAPPASATPALQGAVFEMPVAPPARRAEPVATSPEAAPESISEATLHGELVRCLSYSIEREEGRMPTATESIRLRVSVRNLCDRPFAAADSAFEVRAVSQRGGATAGRQIGRFQGTIPARGSADTVLDIQARNDDFYRFEAAPAADAGAGKKALE